MYCDWWFIQPDAYNRKTKEAQYENTSPNKNHRGLNNPMGGLQSW